MAVLVPPWLPISPPAIADPAAEAALAAPVAYDCVTGPPPTFRPINPPVVVAPAAETALAAPVAYDCVTVAVLPLLPISPPADVAVAVADVDVTFTAPVA